MVNKQDFLRIINLYHYLNFGGLRLRELGHGFLYQFVYAYFQWFLTSLDMFHHHIHLENKKSSTFKVRFNCNTKIGLESFFDLPSGLKYKVRKYLVIMRALQYKN